jgi:hypothetical protein
MTGHGPAGPAAWVAGPVPVVLLACTACQLVYEPDLADFGTGNTGCPRCGGWTWIAQLGSGEWPAVISADHGAAQPQVLENTCSDPAVTPPRTPAGSGSPLTSR